VRHGLETTTLVLSVCSAASCHTQAVCVCKTGSRTRTCMYTCRVYTHMCTRRNCTSGFSRAQSRLDLGQCIEPQTYFDSTQPAAIQVADGTVTAPVARLLEHLHQPVAGTSSWPVATRTLNKTQAHGHKREDCVASPLLGVTQLCAGLRSKESRQDSATLLAGGATPSEPCVCQQMPTHVRTLLAQTVQVRSCHPPETTQTGNKIGPDPGAEPRRKQLRDTYGSLYVRL
jgi:hypothetical protein